MSDRKLNLQRDKGARADSVEGEANVVVVAEGPRAQGQVRQNAGTVIGERAVVKERARVGCMDKGEVA
jgi:hypothetical protein